MPRGAWGSRSAGITSIDLHDVNPRLSDDEDGSYAEDDSSEPDESNVDADSVVVESDQDRAYSKLMKAEKKLNNKDAASTSSSDADKDGSEDGNEEPEKEQEYDEQEIPGPAPSQPARRMRRAPPAEGRPAASGRATTATASVLRERAPERTPAPAGRRANAGRIRTPAADDKENRAPSPSAHASNNLPRGSSSSTAGRGPLKMHPNARCDEEEDTPKPPVIELSSGDEGGDERSSGRRRLHRNDSPSALHRASSLLAEQSSSPADAGGKAPGRLKRLRRNAPSEDSEEEKGPSAAPVAPSDESEDEPLVRPPWRRPDRRPSADSEGDGDGEGAPPVKAEAVSPPPPPPPPPPEADAAPLAEEPFAVWVEAGGEAAEQAAPPFAFAFDEAVKVEKAETVEERREDPFNFDEYADDAFLDVPTFGPRASSSSAGCSPSAPPPAPCRRPSKGPAASSSAPRCRSSEDTVGSSSAPRCRSSEDTVGSSSAPPRRSSEDPAPSPAQPRGRPRRPPASPAASPPERRDRPRRPRKRTRRPETSPRPRRPPAKGRRSRNTKQGYEKGDDFIQSDSSEVHLDSDAEAALDANELRNQIIQEGLEKVVAEDQEAAERLGENMREDAQRPLANGLLSRLDKDKFREGDLSERNEEAFKAFVRLLFRKHKRGSLAADEEGRHLAAQAQVERWLMPGVRSVQCNIWQRDFYEVLRSRPILREDECDGRYERCGSCNHVRDELSMLWFEGTKYDAERFWQRADHRPVVELTNRVGFPVAANCWTIARRWHYLYHYKYYLTNVLWNMSGRADEVDSDWIADEFEQLTKYHELATDYRRTGQEDRAEGFQHFKVFGGMVRRGVREADGEWAGPPMDGEAVGAHSSGSEGGWAEDG